MNSEQIIRAWKDEDYRSGLSGEELSALPAHPAGVIELDGAELDTVAGANLSELLWTSGCCPNLFSLFCEMNTMNIKGLLGCAVPG